MRESFNKKRQFLALMIFFLIICSFIYFEQAGAIFSWFLSLIILSLGAIKYDRVTKQGNRFALVVVGSYFIISLVGMIEIGDNLRNFNTLFGKHADDSMFFLRTSNILFSGEYDDQTGLFEVVMATVGFIPSLLWGQSHFGLLDLLPFNWALGAVIVGLCDELCEKITERRPPLWLLACAVLGNYKFMDTSIHLYRDMLLFVFFLAGIIILLRSRYFWSGVLSIPVFILRGASFYLYSIFYALFVIRNRLKSRIRFYIICCFFIGLGFVVIPHVGPKLLDYATGIPGMGYTPTVSSMTFEERIAFRLDFISKHAAGGSTLERIFSAKDTLLAYLGQPLNHLFFPIRFWPISMPGESFSIFALTSSISQGLFFINIYVWLSVVCWIFIIPLLALGLAKALLGNNNENVLFVYYLLSVILVSFVSMQMRHSLAFIVMNPIIANMGYYMYKARNSARSFALIIGALVMIILTLYNVAGGDFIPIF